MKFRCLPCSLLTSLLPCSSPSPGCSLPSSSLLPPLATSILSFPRSVHVSFRPFIARSIINHPSLPQPSLPPLPLPPCLTSSLPPSLPPHAPYINPTLRSPSLLPCLLLPACVPPVVQLDVHRVCTVLASCTGYCVGRVQPCVALRQWRGRAISRWLAVTLGERTPTTNPFLTNRKKSDDRHVQRTHLNTVAARTFPRV